MDDIQRDWITEHVKHQLRLAEQRRWEEQKRLQAEERERYRRQTALEAYLRERGRLWMDTTGTPPSRDALLRWQQEYVDAANRKRAAEAEERRARAQGIWD
jgi:hypothetical protein